MYDNITDFSTTNVKSHAVPFVIIVAILSIFIVLANSFVVLTVLRYRHLRTPTNFIIFSLAVSDLLNGLLGAPLMCYHEMTSCSSRSSNFAAAIPPAFGRYLGTVSFMHVVALTADRYVAVTRPLRYASSITNKKVLICVTEVWVSVSLLYLIHTIITMQTFVSEGTGNQCDGSRLTNTVDLWTYGLLTAIALCAIPSLIVFNLHILMIAIRQSTAIANLGRALSVEEQQRDANSSRLKAVKTTSMIVGLFCLCWSPAVLHLLLRMIVDMRREVFIASYYFSFSLTTISSVLNPVIYCYRNQAFREAFRSLVRRH
ncbi:neuromedin-U receptor 2-like [Diadema setosum]|uniref:neuromedin-U receptor 2-like n=1 Tax=Diadema setosum TaxID=31175 RepID=UPI003B3A18B0